MATVFPLYVFIPQLMDIKLVELVRWKTLTEGQEELQWLSEVLNCIWDEFKDISLNSVISAYSLSLLVFKWNGALVESHIAMIKDLLDNGLYLHGKMEVSSSIVTQALILNVPSQLMGQDGLTDSCYVPFVNSGIRDLIEIILVEKGYNQFICYDGTNRWKFCLKNTITFLCTTWKWVPIIQSQSQTA
jgi:hypothetical protein